MSIYNEDELVAPNWLTKEFLLKVLKESEKDEEIELLSFDITPASMKGDHYASCMFRAKLKYRTPKNDDAVNCALIIKTMPDEDSKKNELLKDYPLFETEISMYTKTLPEIQKILAEHGDNTIFGPRVLYAALKPKKVIIFEDLCVRGYDCVRGRSLSSEELNAVFTKLAKLHAVSYAVGLGENARLVNKYQQSIYSDETAFMDNDMMCGGFKRFKRLLESDDELRVYLPQFKVEEDEIFRGCLELVEAFKNGEPDDIYVLNHGDFHGRNIMYKLDENEKVEDVMMVDFQISIFAPCVLDLIYSIFMMFDPETRLKRRDEILRFYFEQFISTLKLIKFKGKLPEFGQLQISSLKYRRFAKFLLVTFMPMVHMMFSAKPEDLKDFDINEAVEKEDGMMFAYMNPNFIADLKLFLPEFLNRGYLD